MNIFGLHITRASTLKKERKAWKDIVDKGVKGLLEAASIVESDRAAYAKQNSLWNRVISKLLFENHQLRMAK